MRAELLELIHAGAACHLGVRKTIDQVQRRAYWFSWKSDTDRFCRRCGPCNQYVKGSLEAGTASGHEGRRPHEPSRAGSYWASRFRKWIDVYLHCDVQLHEVRCGVVYSRQESYHCHKGLMERVILPLGSFLELRMDNEKEFENKLCHELCRPMRIEKLKTTFYTPQCNGCIERWHSTMNSLLAKTV